MPFFIKTEKFTDNTKKLSIEEKKVFLLMHKDWVEALIESGEFILSGYLTNEKKIPGGGGVLILEANDYLEAKNVILNDPMIVNKLVTWELQEWNPIIENIKNKFIHHLG